MSELSTPCGRLVVDTKEALFARAAALVADSVAAAPVGHAPLIAFAGGSTPQDWFRWCAATRALPAAVAASAHFTVSDERYVPTDDPQSNFGHAARLLLDPLGVPAAHRHPWPVALPPPTAAENYRATVRARVRPEPACPEPVERVERAYNLCFLGLGDDAHTASLFPDSPLLGDDGGELFAAVEVPGKGWRLTITPSGLRACGQIVVMALGAAKAPALARVLRGPADFVQAPAQILQTCAPRVLWLVDAPAAAQLSSA
jgi:6-phosphogluconolactonase